jgi:hypothetical protein
MILSLASGVIQIWIGLGQIIFLLKLIRKGEGDYGSIFAGGPYLIRMILASLLMVALFATMFLVCAIPAVIAGFATKQPEIGFLVFVLVVFFPFIYVTLAISPCQYLVVDQGLGPLDALQASFAITKGNKLAIFAAGLVAGLFGLLGLFGCCIGIVFTAPFALVTITVMYLCMTGQGPVATDLYRR